MKLLAALLSLLLTWPVSAQTCAPVFHYSVHGDISEDQAASFRRLLEAARKAGAHDVEIEINSPGGEVDAGLDMVRALKGSGLRSTCTARGIAGSMGFVLLQACDRRLAAPGTKLATHQVYGSFGCPANICIQTVEMLEERANRLRMLAAVTNGIIAARLGMSVSKYVERVANGKTWEMTAPEALAAKAIDGVLLQ